MKHKETIEKSNLAERKGGFHSSASEEIHNPDQKSTYFMGGNANNDNEEIDAERFDRDYTVHEKKEREEKFSKKMQEIEKRK